MIIPVIGAEHPGYYCDQGFHPVHIDDQFSNGRYTVKHKLGHGAFSTIWLVYDSTTRTYASLKILAARQSLAGNELAVLKHLQSTFDATEEGSQHVLQMLDHFEHQGPNGRHLCIVTEVLGLSLATSIEELWEDEVLPPEVAKRLIGQISLGTRYLHRRNVAHGDLHTGNILLYSPKIRSWTERDVDEYIGQPNGFSVEFHGPGPDVPLVLPKYLVPSNGYWYQDDKPFLRLCYEDPQIKICDFGESFIPSLPHPRGLATPRIFRPPEGLLGGLPHATREADIWALAVLFQLLYTGGFPVFHADGDDIMLRDMVLLLGKLPEPWWSLWNNRREFFDDNANFLPDPGTKSFPSRVFLKISVETMAEEEERSKFEQLLRSMVRYDPTQRITAEGIVASEWFVKYCRSAL